MSGGGNDRGGVVAVVVASEAAAAPAVAAALWRWWQRQRQRQRQQCQRHHGSVATTEAAAAPAVASASWWGEVADRDSGGTGSGIGRGCTGEFSRAKAKKSFGSTYARKIEAKKTSRSTIRATPKIGDFHFRRWWPIFTCDKYFAMLTSRPPGFSDVVAHGFCMRVPLRG